MWARGKKVFPQCSLIYYGGWEMLHCFCHTGKLKQTSWSRQDNPLSNHSNSLFPKFNRTPVLIYILKGKNRTEVSQVWSDAVWNHFGEPWHSTWTLSPLVQATLTSCCQFASHIRRKSTIGCCGDTVRRSSRPAETVKVKTLQSSSCGH